jgi:hypothetical protein
VLVHARRRGSLSQSLCWGDGIAGLEHGAGGIGRIRGLVLRLLGQGHRLAVGEAR